MTLLMSYHLNGNIRYDFWLLKKCCACEEKQTNGEKIKEILRCEPNQNRFNPSLDRIKRILLSDITYFACIASSQLINRRKSQPICFLLVLFSTISFTKAQGWICVVGSLCAVSAYIVELFRCCWPFFFFFVLSKIYTSTLNRMC